MNKLVFALGLVAALGGAAQAQTVWRCGPEGRLYSDEPCAGGRLVQVTDPRSDEQVAAARKQAAEEAGRARALVHERLQREADAQARTALAAGIGPDAGPVLRPKGASRGHRLQQLQAPPRQAKRPPRRPAAEAAAPSREAARGSRPARG